MSPSGNDVDLSFNPKGILAAVREVDKAFADMGKGVEGAAARAETAVGRLTTGALQFSSRAEQSQKRYIQSLEMTASQYGKNRTELERLGAAQDVLLKRYAGHEKVLDAINKQYSIMKQRATEAENAAKGGSGGQSGSLAFRAARDFFEGRTAFAEVQTAKLLGSLSGLPLILGGVAAGMAAVGIAAYESYKHLATYGVEIEKLKITTGLTTNEVYEFGIVAKASGGSIESFVTIMRMLDKGLADNSAAGKTARDELRALNIVMRDAGTGQTRPMSEVIVDLSKALNAIEDPAKRGVAAINVLGRGGLAALPEILKISSGLKAVRDSGLEALKDSDVQKWAGWNVQLTIAEEKLTAIWRRLQDMTGTAGSSALAAVNEDKYGIFANVAKFGLESANPIGFLLSRGINTGGGGKAGGASVDSADLPLATLLHPGEYSNRAGLPQDLEALRNNVQKLKVAYDEARESYDKFPTNVRTELWQKELGAVKQAGAAYLAASDSLKELEKIESHRISIMERANELRREGAGYYRFGSGLLETVVAESEMLTTNAARTRGGPRLFGSGESAPFDLSKPEFPFAPLPAGMNSLGFVSPGSDRTSAAYTEGQSEFAKGLVESEREKQRITLAGIEAEAKAQERLLEYRGEHGEEIATARAVAAVRQSALDREYDLTKNVKKLQEESQQVQLDMALKIAEVQKRQAESISHVAGGLFTTLFTSPSKFGGHLSSTLRSAALSPITQGLGDMTASLLHPLIFGPGGEGGIAGALHGAFGGGRTSPVGTLSDPIAVTVTNIHEGSSQYSMPTWGTTTRDFSLGGRGGSVSQGGIPGSVLSLALGGLMQSVGGGGGGPRGAVTYNSPFGDLTGATYGAPQASWPVIGGMGPAEGESLGFPVGGVSGGYGIGGMRGAASSTNPLARLASIFGGKGGGGGFNLSGFKNLDWGGFTRQGQGIPGVDANTPGIDTGGAGRITGVSGLAGAGLMMGGTALAKAGLLGNNRGSWAGTFEGAAGGAMIGMQVGGPLGAAIGAGVGAGIGLGEQLAGVEPQWKEAQRLVRQAYGGIFIDRNTGQHIADLANQSYAGHVSLAVRSPEVRQMLGLYAAGTGQAAKFPQSASSPHGASLVESGGSLYQGASYSYGSAFAFQSSLPIYGGPIAGTLPQPGGPTYVALNFDGKSAGDAMTGMYVTPDLVSTRTRQAWSASNGRMADSLTMSEPGAIAS